MRRNPAPFWSLGPTSGRSGLAKPPSRLQRPADFDGALGRDPWDSAKLATASVAWTSAQQQIVAFLLSVWNSKQVLSTFNLVDAVSKWEAGDREALVVRAFASNFL